MTILDIYAAFVHTRAKVMNTRVEDLHHATTGMAGEAGEALDITKKMWVYGQQLDTPSKESGDHLTHLVEELGDCLFYIQHAANLLHVSVEYLLTQNMEKLRKRYPEGYSDAAAAARADKVAEISPEEVRRREAFNSLPDDYEVN